MTEPKPAEPTGPEPAATCPAPAARPAAHQRLLGWIRGGGWRPLLAGALGASAMAAYANFVGCKAGTCPLTSSVRNAALYGGLVGLLVGWPSKAAAPPQRSAR
jgi:hypothetical protein